ncbi:MAG: DNA repair protein RecN, partial [Leptolyngbyaceae cyanobacterium SM1_1_3]|nr:DNA repair protein RecN [Leptolyngbyaceae cyanobacterium SM1_1_3]
MLGGKASSRQIRSGEKKALVEATFIPPVELQDWLAQQAIPLPESGYLVCSRELTASRGAVRSRSRLNGVVVNKPQVEVLKQSLVEITAQGQTMQLGAANLQQSWLDGFGGAKLLIQRDRVGQAYQRATAAFQALDRRRQAEQQRLQQLDLFEFQGQELNRAALEDADELVSLQQEQQRLSHAVELQQQSYQVYQVLYENDGDAAACADLLGKASSILEDMLRFDPEVEPIIDLVSEAMAQVEKPD